MRTAILVLICILVASAAWGRITGTRDFRGAEREMLEWAAGDVRAALAEKGVREEDALVQVRVAKDEEPAEGFAIRAPAFTVTVTGGDARGAMYGLQEVAERVRRMPPWPGGEGNAWGWVVGRIGEARQAPALEYRADNPYIHVREGEGFPAGTSLNDVEMWRAYIDMLARARFNALDLHGGYVFETTYFPNLYPLLVHVPEYPQVGDRARQERNLADLKAIAAHCARRGVTLGLLNYNTPAEGVEEEKLADYTARAVARLLREAPDLGMLGFRVGESGRDESFLKDAYLRGVALSARKDVRLYSRSWLASRAQLEGIGKAVDGQFDVEIKYNGEQLGLPYHALHGKHGEAAGGTPSYSYEDYIRPAAPYRIIWQVRANGTHRFWTWADTEFIRRTVKTLGFGGARGFSLEPHIAFFSTNAADLYARDEDKAVYRWTWEKHWYWYQAWGRLAYNPALPEGQWAVPWGARFGEKAGAAMYHALQAAGPIVPLACAYRYQGPDHRHYSPETETGAFFPRDDAEPGVSRYGGDVREGGPMDKRSFVGIVEFLNDRAAGRYDGRLTPFRVAGLFTAAATATRAAVAAADLAVAAAPDARTRDEWRLLRTDLLAAACLGEYHAARIMGVVHWNYAVRTGSRADFTKAMDYLRESRAAWGRLAETCDPVYAPLSNMLRLQKDYKWASQLAALEQLDATPAERFAKRGADPAAKPLAFTPQDCGEAADVQVTGLGHDVRGGRVTVSAKVKAEGGVPWVFLWWKPLPSTEWWRQEPMRVDMAGAATATLDLPREGMLYMLEVRTGTGRVVNYPYALQETPYRVVDAGVAAGE